MHDKNELFESMKLSKAIGKLAIPTILSSLVTVLYNLADTYFVGMLNDPVQTAAVTLAAPVLLAFNAVNNLFGVGTSSMMSRALGRRDHDTVRKSSAFGFYCSLFSGILFSALCIIFAGPLMTMLGTEEITYKATADYMFWTVSLGATPAIINVVMAYLVRSEGASMHASIGTMSGCILNIILDPIFILPWGLNMGAAGAGLATFISNCVACLYFAVLLMKKRGNTLVCVDFRKFSFDREIAKGVFAVGIPASIQNLLNVTGMTILNNFTASYGAAAVSAMGIAKKIDMIPMQVALGFSQGIMPLVSYTYASRNYRRMKDAIIMAIKIIIPPLIVAMLLFTCFSELFIGMFIANEEIIAYGSAFLKAYAISLPFLCFDFLVIGVFQAHGNGKAAFIFALLRKIVLEIPAIILLNMLFPLYGLPYSQFVTEFTLSIAQIYMLRKIFRKCTE